MYIDLREPKWAEIVEGTLDKLVNAFAVTDVHDAGLLRAIMTKNYGNAHYKPIVCRPCMHRSQLSAADCAEQVHGAAVRVPAPALGVQVPHHCRHYRCPRPQCPEHPD